MAALRKTHPVKTQTNDPIAALGPWKQRIALPASNTSEARVTPGHYPLDFSAYGLPTSCSGLRILDLNTRDGAFAFECLLRGAHSVVACDDFSDPTDPLTPDWRRFDFALNQIAPGCQRIQRLTAGIYDLEPTSLAPADLTLFHHGFERLPHINLACQIIAALTKHALLLSYPLAESEKRSPESTALILMAAGFAKVESWNSPAEGRTVFRALKP